MKSFKVMLSVVFVLAIAVIAYAQGPGYGGYGMGPGMMGGYGRRLRYGTRHDGWLWSGIRRLRYGTRYDGWLRRRLRYGTRYDGRLRSGLRMGPGMMGGYGGGYGMGPGMMGGYGGYGRGPASGYNQSEECQKFLDDSTKLRKELHSKRFEYFEAYRNPDTKSETLAKLDREIRALQEKIYEKAPEGGCGW